MAGESPVPGQQVAQRVTLAVPSGVSGTTHDIEVRFWLYLPADAGAHSKRPLLLFLHGAGERGDDLNHVKIHGPPKLIENGRHFPLIVVSPQQPRSDESWRKDQWSPQTLMALVDHVATKHDADPSRLYVTGLSMGGYGTWSLITSYPDRFAAAVPICGGGIVEQSKRLVHIPIWAFHGDADQAVPLAESRKMVDAVNKAGGNAKLTIYPGVGHDSWTRTYENSALYDWLLSHRQPAE